MRLGLYGGSFDPVHRGHLMVAQAALEELGLDRLVFIPAWQSPFKPDVRPASGSERLRWLRMALVGQSRCCVDSIELEREGTSYTIDTVRAFRDLHPEASFFYLIGADHVPQLPLWRDAESLAALVEFVVIPRPGSLCVSLPKPYRIRHLKGWPIAVSSSEIRDRVRRGLAIHHLVPDAVAEDLSRNVPYSGGERTEPNTTYPQSGFRPNGSCVDTGR
jgi:nicotinate-nucleotide adenylyltransferase